MEKESAISGPILKIKEFILDTVFPVECLGCGKEGKWLCEKCLPKIRPDRHSLSGQSLDKIITFHSYDNELLKKAIHFLKYKFVENLAEPLGGLMAKGLRELSRRPEKEFIIIPVPLHKKRFLDRGFNQAALLAEIISRDFGWRIGYNILERERATSPQVDLEEGARKENISGAFRVIDNLKVIDKKIVLIDDVLTTGSTMEECATMLKQSGAKEVWGIALAKG